MATKKKEEYQGTKYDSYQAIMNGAQNSTAATTKPMPANQGTKHDSFIALMGGTQPVPRYNGQQNTQAQTYTQTQAPSFKPQDNPWYQQAQQLMGQIQNRGPFQFNLNENALYQQYKQNYQKMGQQAMMDTMGQAAGLTGGYGSSYGQAVGNQAYNEYLTKLGDIVPELYAQERAAYDAEGNNLYQMLNAARGMYDTDYGMWRDQMEDYWRNTEWDENLRRYNQEWNENNRRYNQEWNEGNRRYNQEWDESNRRYNQEWAHSVEQDRIANEHWEREFGFSREQFENQKQQWAAEFGLDRERFEAALDQWAQEFAYGKEQDAQSQANWERQFGLSREQFDAGLQQWAASHDLDVQRLQQSILEYNNSYAQSQQDSTYSRVMQQLSSGYMPSAEELQAAGISQGYAQYLVGLYAQQAEAAQGSTGGSNPGYVPQVDPIKPPPEVPPVVPPDLGTTVDGNPVEAMPDGYNVNTIRNYCMGAETAASAKQRLNRYSRYLTAEQYNTIYQLILGGWGTGNYFL